ncbi:class I SAM-dependent methyltransferase [Pseudomonas entomophila]|uniref:class I SAM-dependent methyltransferase n=1 Tax=Pseudomonas entomophila TaxID=312306 RepID=UPI0023D81D8E|nr:class I SAM-dependent methyltransferase [Pseudomonas entomophila]MDF0729875.1 class I SAM-dependent methyltransferase [Pseudomonas entomophila]
MARIYTKPGDKKPRLDKQSILDFFEKRAQKAADLGPTRAVIYQDKSLDLAERRDQAEKALLLPKLKLKGDSRVLDAGCGTGRWAEVVIPRCSSYVGVDVSPGLVEVAKQRFSTAPNAQFHVCAVDAITPDGEGMDLPFSQILSFGVFIYLNDDEITHALNGYLSVAGATARILFREPIAVSERLTLLEHFSDDMNQQYNAIYRTENELQELMQPTLQKHGFHQVAEGDVYSDNTLNNRVETKQKWFLWEKE